MKQYFAGLDSTAVNRAIRKTGERVFLTTLVSALLSIVAMQLVMNQVHPIGIYLAILMPLLLSTPTTLFMCLKHQQLRAANIKLEKLASMDCLTGAFNRRAFAAKAEPWLNASAASDPAAQIAASGALLVVDIDHFKQVNDRFGHEAGDITLQLLVAELRSALPAGSIVGRIGGEEFAVFLPLADAADAVAEATNICRRVQNTDFSAAGVDLPITVSVGVALAHPGAQLRQLFRDADTKLYRAKSDGRNRVIFNETTSAAIPNAA